MKYIAILCIMVIAFAAPWVGAAEHTEANVMVEIPFQAKKAHAKPSRDVTLDVVFTDPKGDQNRAGLLGGRRPVESAVSLADYGHAHNTTTLRRLKKT